tara:strand:- start:220 stop:630 length:411 start_codon:yes stop_codon:yes gene_type:complete
MIKIKDSKGNIYDSCPFINSIQELCKQQKEIIDQIISDLEKVRAINGKLRDAALSEEAIEKIKETSKREVWETVGDIIGFRKDRSQYRYQLECDERVLKENLYDKEGEIKNLKDEIENLTSKNQELLDQLTDLKNE